MRINLLITIASILLFVGATVFQAESDAGETPRTALATILELHKKQDWEALVQTRCLGAEYVSVEDARNYLIDQLERDFSNADRRTSILHAYEAALAVQPEIEVGGKRAVFLSEQGTIVLSRMDSGVWGIRL